MGIEIRPHDLPVDPPTEKELEKRSRKLFGNIEAILSRLRGFGKSRRSKSKSVRSKSKGAKSATKSKLGIRSSLGSRKASKTASKTESLNNLFVEDVSSMSSGPGKKKSLKKKKVKKVSSVNKNKVKSPGSNGKSMRSFYSRRRSKFGKKK
jgi:hypothetical protein